MINNSIISFISLSFNDSLIAHIGSRIYRIALEALERFFDDTFPNQLYSGLRLYRLVDAYRQSNRDEMSYDRARFYYAGGIITALQNERDPLEKARKAKSILNTHVLGLSILQAKDKNSLSKHISYTLLPSLIDEFGKKMATKSILALHELDSMVAFRNDNPDKYVNLYRDIALQQKELDSYVQALDQLNSGISKDILINELLLSRNRNLSKTAKDKITEILRSEHYIDIKLHKKLQTVDLLRNRNYEVQLDKTTIISELHENRNNQLEALFHTGTSIFFGSDELDNTSPHEGEDEFSYSMESLDTSLPVGISNTQLNCWYNSTLQILRNTPIYWDILKKKDKFAEKFPNIFASFNAYQRAFIEQMLYPENFSLPKVINIDLFLPKIRKEAHHNLSKEFKEVEVAQEDSQCFLYTLLNKLSISVAHQIWLPGEKIPFAKEKHLFLEKPASSQLVDNPNIALAKIDLKTLFADTNHELYGVIFHTGADYSRGRNFDNGHYFVTVKMRDDWYLCNDSRIAKISETEVENLLQKKKALLIASRTNSDQTESNMD